MFLHEQSLSLKKKQNNVVIIKLNQSNNCCLYFFKSKDLVKDLVHTKSL